jgi:hypothetical protein
VGHIDPALAGVEAAWEAFYHCGHGWVPVCLIFQSAPDGVARRTV